MNLQKILPFSFTADSCHHQCVVHQKSPVLDSEYHTSSSENGCYWGESDEICIDVQGFLRQFPVDTTGEAVDKAVLKERKKKAARAELEQPFSTLTDVDAYSIPTEDAAIDNVETESISFVIGGQAIPVKSLRIGTALSFLLPKEREIIILYYFVGMTDTEIGRYFGVNKTTINRRRRAAEKKLRKLLEDTT